MDTTEKNLEEAKQELHCLNYKYNLAKSMELEFKTEIENLQNICATDYKEITCLKEKITTLKLEQTKQSRHYDDILENKDAEIKRLSAQIKELNVNTKVEVDDTLQIENERLHGIVLELRNDKSLLEERLALSAENEEIATGKRVEYEQLIRHLQEQISNYKEVVQSQNENIGTLNETKTQLQEELALMRLEVESLKVATVDQSKKGNSLFSEVYDSRNRLKKQISEMKANYQLFKRENVQLLHRINKLQADNNCLEKKYLEIYCIKKDVEKHDSAAYETQIADLTSTVNRLQEKLSKTPYLMIKGHITDITIMEWVYAMGKQFKKEYLEFEQKLCEQSSLNFLSTMELKSTKHSLYRAELRNIELERKQQALESDLLQKNVSLLQINIEEESSLDHDTENKETASTSRDSKSLETEKNEVEVPETPAFIKWRDALLANDCGSAVPINVTCIENSSPPKRPKQNPVARGEPKPFKKYYFPSIKPNKDK